MQTTDTPQDILSDIVQPPPIASIGKRIAAALIDGVILLVIFVVLGSFFGERNTTTTTTTTTIMSGTSVTTNDVTHSTGFTLTGIPALVFMLGWFFLIPFSEGQSGQTLGKRALGIRILKLNGDPANIGLSIARHLFDGIDCFFLIGLIIASTSKERRRIGDLVAGTIVVEKAMAVKS